MTAARAILIGGCFLSLLLLQALAGDDPPVSPLSPEQGLRSLRVPRGLKVELFAAEPHVMDPVAMAFDENGRVYVVEMGDYPLGKNGGRVKLLQDTKGTGRIDRSTVFADRLSFPNGVLPWKGGALVTSAPNILYLKDADGDGKADERRVVFTGFAETNPQHRFNHPTFGLDNWIYGADGESPTGIRPGDRPDAPAVPLRGSDFRFRPDFSRFEPISARSQFAMTFDDWGDRFINNNSNHLRHPVLPQHYLKRNPYLAVPEVIDEIAGGRSWKVHPASRIEPRFNDLFAAGFFTSACAVTLYRGDGLPAEYRGNAFTCEPVHNLVHRDVLTPHGIAFDAKGVPEDGEFLASTDNWFRPVNLTVGPDGALYVVDMYRAVIEHPQWIPLDVQKKLDLYAGHDRGRIYRVVPEGGLAPARPRLGSAGAAELVGYLAHPNAWWRETAQRLLIERQDKSAVSALRELAHGGKTPLARLHALWTLEGLAALDDDLIALVLKDSEPHLREHGLRLSEPRLPGNAALREAVVKHADDPDLRVRFQAAFTLGEIRHDEAALNALARIAARDAGDRWVRTAILSSVPETAARLLAVLHRDHRAFLDRPPAGAVEFVHQLAGVVGGRHQPAEVAEFLRLVVAGAKDEPLRWQLAALAGLNSGLRGSGTALAKFLSDPAVRPTLTAWTSRALATALARDHDAGERVDAIVLLTLAPSAETARLKELLRPQEPQQVQTAAVRALAALPGDQGAAALLADWNSRTVSVRREILSLLLARPERTALLLDALEKGEIRVAELDAARRDQLLRYPKEDLRTRARKLLDAQPSSNRQQLVEEWSAKVLPLTGDAVHGQQVYAAHCATCHRLHGQGVAVGPDLASVSGRPKDALLIDVLDPNRAVDPAYLDYVVVTRNDQFFNGILATETANSVTLRRAERQETTVLRRDIAEIRSSGVSLMPEGMEKVLSPQDLADLLELLRRGPLH